MHVCGAEVTSVTPKMAEHGLRCGASAAHAVTSFCVPSHLGPHGHKLAQYYTTKVYTQIQVNYRRTGLYTRRYPKAEEVVAFRDDGNTLGAYTQRQHTLELNRVLKKVYGLFRGRQRDARCGTYESASMSLQAQYVLSIGSRAAAPQVPSQEWACRITQAYWVRPAYHHLWVRLSARQGSSLLCFRTNDELASNTNPFTALQSTGAQGHWAQPPLPSERTSCQRRPAGGDRLVLRMQQTRQRCHVCRWFR